MSRGLQVRKTIELFCRILKDNGMSNVEAETLRKAKYDEEEACFPLWRLLFELISFCQCGITGSSVVTAFSNMITEDQVMYVKKEMQRRGYLSRAFATLPTNMSKGSRELLLALAWLLNKEAIVEKFTKNLSSPIDHDILSLFEQTESEKGCGQLFLNGSNQSPANQVQQMLVLNNKLKMNLRLLHACQREYATLTHRIHSSTYGLSLYPDMDHLTSMQVYMLRHPQHLKKVLSLLEQDSTRLENLLQWEDKETGFWEWMESVLEMKVKAAIGGGDAATVDGDSVNTNINPVRTIFLDVPATIGSDIAASRRNLMNMILHYESAIERLEDLWATKQSTISKLELDGLLKDINAEIVQLQTCLGHEHNKCEKLPSVPGRRRLVFLKSKGGHHVAAKVSATGSTPSQDIHQEVTLNVHEEIGRLQKEANKLEEEVTGLRRDCLQKLTKIISNAPNTICIIPPQLRKLCQ